MHLAIVAAKTEAKSTPRPATFRQVLQSALQPIARFALASATVTTALIPVAGCGNTYRPVVSAISPVGPAAQPIKYALAVASNPNGTNGLMTMVDFSGDTVLININVGVAPYYFALDSGGFTGYTLNGDQTLTSFDISTQVQTKDVLQTTLLANANPASLLSIGGTTYVAEPGRSSIAQFKGTPPALQQEFAVDPNPVYIVGVNGTPRVYAISQNTAGSNGTVAAIETSTNTKSTTLPVGKGPVYGVMTSDNKRSFIVNKTDGTVTVINSQTNQLDTPTTTIPVGVAPVWADLVPTLSELVVTNQGSGTSPGSVSIINIPLCQVSAQPTNPNCNATNPIDAVGFGQVLATVPVGRSPVMVAVLQDGTRAYVANFADSTVSVVNLTSNTVTATIPVVGRPIYIAATQGTPTGKVYVVSADTVAPNKNSVMTIINTVTDTVSSTVNLQGTGVSVRVTQP